MWFYRIVWTLVAQGSRLVFRARVEGLEKVPATGGFVLAPSHRSMMDIPFAALVSRRRVRFMGKAPLFRIPVLGAAFRALGGFPVERDGSDRKAVRDSIDILQSGEPLVVFPEGTRQNGPVIQELQPGAAYLSLRAGVPIVPVGIAGTEEIFRSHGTRLPRFGRVAVVVGDPIPAPERTTGAVPRAQVEAHSGDLATILQQRFDDAYRLRHG